MQFRFSAIGVLIASFFLLLILSGGLFYAWKFVHIPAEHLKVLLFGVSMFASALITIVFYQSVKIYDSASNIAEHITKDILQYSHDLFTELYRSSPVPYVVIDTHGKVVSMNLATARLFHTESNALEGINLFSFFKNDAQQKAALVPEYFKEGKSLSDVELELERPDGATRWVNLSLFSFTDTNREKRGLVTLVDVTKQKQIDKAKTEFVSLASHQLRTPISGLKWNIELLLTSGMDTFNTTQRNLIEKITHGTERMETLINDFLSASKFELGTLEPTYTEVAVQEFLEKITDELASMSEDKGVRIQVTSVNDLGSMNTDAHMLHNIVSNLMTNAIKYTLQGGVVTLQVERLSGRMSFKVSDTGIGIPKEDQEMIFSKMYRASNARTALTDGTGLGLYIVKESITVLRGSISFLSEENNGTEFTVVLPT